ncbi:methyltransferase [uncultured bacterium]|nr:methyltransferase [uncultured bacterium]
MHNKFYYFYNRKFLCLNGVYSPKHETEHIIFLLEYTVSKFFKNNIKILEVGCGTGCIGITALLELSKYNFKINMNMIDIKHISIKNTHINLKKYNLYSKVYHRNIFNFLIKCDILISNPPYLEIDEFQFKHLNLKTNQYIDDYINCVGGINWINRLLKIANCKFIILEISDYQLNNINLLLKYKIIKIIKPFINSKIIFILLKHL